MAAEPIRSPGRKQRHPRASASGGLRRRRRLGGIANGAVEGAHRFAGAIFGVPNAAQHGKKIRPRRHKGGAVFRRDAADGDAGYVRCLAPPFKNFRSRAMGRLFCQRWVKGTKGDVIGTGLGGFDRQVARIVAGHAKDGVRAEQAAGFGARGIVLADMHAIGADVLGKAWVIVDKQGHVAGVADGEKRFRRFADGGVGHVFQAQLNASDIAGVQCFG